jgi:hypothetical protein
MTKIYDGTIYTIYLDSGKVLELTREELEELEGVGIDAYDAAIDTINAINTIHRNMLDDIAAIEKIFRDNETISKKNRSNASINLSHLHGDIDELNDTIKEFYQGI